jgi:endoglucanase
MSHKAKFAWLLSWTLCIGLLTGGCSIDRGQPTNVVSNEEDGNPAPQLHVFGNQLVNAHGQQVVLHGVNRSGGQYACVQGRGIWSGPMNQASISAMRRWHVNAVRLPLNEACWNGQHYIKTNYRGALYRKAVKSYVRLLNRNGIVAILDLHWTDGAYAGPSSPCSSSEAVCQKPMPDAAQSIPFWVSVATTFKGNDAVIFDLFNEPYPEKAVESEAAAWRCWLRGGNTCKGIPYKVAGMQSLVDAIRSTGAKNIIMIGGLRWANDLADWLKYEPFDPDHNIAASWHSYNFNACNTQACWDSQIAPVIAKVPVIAGEIGEKDCSDTYIAGLATWLDARSTSYLAWSWNVGAGCASGPSLITNYAGMPTNYGRGYRSHLLSLRCHYNCVR